MHVPSGDLWYPWSHWSHLSPAYPILQAHFPASLLHDVPFWVPIKSHPQGWQTGKPKKSSLHLSHFLPSNFSSLQSQSPLWGLHMLFLLPWSLHSQGWHEGKLKCSTAHLSHVFPTTFAEHSQWPVSLLHLLFTLPPITHVQPSHSRN